LLRNINITGNLNSTFHNVGIFNLVHRESTENQHQYFHKNTSPFTGKENTFSNVSSGAVSKLDGLKLLKRGLLGINVSSAIMAFMDYRNSFKKGPTNMSDHISFASSVVAFGSAYGAIASLYLDGINFAAKKGAVAESSLKNYFSPLSPSNFFKNCFGY